MSSSRSWTLPSLQSRFIGAVDRSFQPREGSPIQPSWWLHHDSWNHTTLWKWLLLLTVSLPSTLSSPRDEDTSPKTYPSLDLHSTLSRLSSLPSTPSASKPTWEPILRDRPSASLSSITGRYVLSTGTGIQLHLIRGREREKGRERERSWVMFHLT